MPEYKGKRVRKHELCDTEHVNGECPILDKEKVEGKFKKEREKFLPKYSPECQMLSHTMHKHCTMVGCENPMHESNRTPKRSRELMSL